LFLELGPLGEALAIAHGTVHTVLKLFACLQHAGGVDSFAMTTMPYATCSSGGHAQSVERIRWGLMAVDVAMWLYVLALPANLLG
jgi:hypothetical protein